MAAVSAGWAGLIAVYGVIPRSYNRLIFHVRLAFLAIVANWALDGNDAAGVAVVTRRTGQAVTCCFRFEDVQISLVRTAFHRF